MGPFLLTAHVLASSLFVSPMAVTTSLSPRLTAVSAEPATERDGERSTAAAQLLHRSARVLALVPLIGGLFTLVNVRRKVPR